MGERRAALVAAADGHLLEFVEDQPQQCKERKSTALLPCNF